MTSSVTEERVGEAARTGADTILAPCSGCTSNLERAARVEGLRTEDVVAPLARSLGIVHENRLAKILAGDTREEILENAAGNVWEETHPRESVERFVDVLLARRTAR